MAKNKGTVTVMVVPVIEHYTDAALKRTIHAIEKKHAEHLQPYYDEIKRREAERLRRAIDDRKEITLRIVENIDLLLSLFKEHEPGLGCADNALRLGYSEGSMCSRCRLLGVKIARYLDPAFAFRLSHTHEPLE